MWKNDWMLCERRCKLVSIRATIDGRHAIECFDAGNPTILSELLNANSPGRMFLVGSPIIERPPQQEPASTARPKETSEQTVAGSESAKMSPRDLAKKHGVEPETLRKRLDRWRYDHDTGYIEVSNPARNEPKYLYDELAVMPIIDELKAKSVGQKRPANVLQKKI